ncbi:putative membrane zinc transporter [Sphaerosporella brunnea]|uniref:Putative membrane zinc transporter n=1 Tax=Sphaerosporella brunnea TaxID=1250544 RepID=A0A5J5EQK0_9PEZI|nr:putative membrane zinc transporter [Sphaerosporella brunnea]
MSTAVDGLIHLLPRQEAEATPPCLTGNDFNGNIGLRISAVFVILVTSSFGTLFPLIARRVPSVKVPEVVFFLCKFFGSGVIVATAFIHLLEPANAALSNPCLAGPITSYPWAQGIALMSVFSMFFVELMTMRYAKFDSFTGALAQERRPNVSSTSSSISVAKRAPADIEPSTHIHSHEMEQRNSADVVPAECPADHIDVESQSMIDNYVAQLTAVFILEFGVIFHSVFIGLTLAVSGLEFKTLYIVLVFHQMFEGLGLGSRLASMQWPENKRVTPWIMAIAYGLSTPTAIAVGLGVRGTYPPNGQTTLIVNGIFDSISAGILLFTGLVELMAHDFLFSNTMREASAPTLFTAFGSMVLGAGLMALLGKWA